MTTAPANLLAVRRLLLDHLDIHDEVRTDDLEPAEVGIVGDPNHRGGYHCGSDRVVNNDYSVVESHRDQLGLTSHASALDVGMFEHEGHNLRTFSTWMVAQCAAKASGTADIREIIYSPDGKTVRRWDRLGRRTTGDDSHLFHTHFSFFRDSTKAGRDQTPLFRRYLTAIGLIADTNGADPMFVRYGDTGPYVEYLQLRLKNLAKLADCDPGDVDGVYKDATQRAVVAFEKYCGIKSDGRYFGPKTATRLDAVWAKYWADSRVAGAVKALNERIDALPTDGTGFTLPMTVTINEVK